jgi:hypothetical protein|tara:strand:+ start:1180 stop:1851 length:672 start_codon:yes stop_codon:yes gene_type:complete
MNKFNIGGFKLPHMSNSALPVKKYKKVEQQRIGANLPPQKPIQQPKPLHPNSGGSSITYHKDGHAPKIASMDRAPELSEDLKAQLHEQANVLGRPFWSEEHQVNVDPEDGVLHNRPVYDDGTKLTYDPYKKPDFESSTGGDEFDIDYSGAEPVDLGTIKPSEFTKAKTKLVEDYGGADNPEYQMEKEAYFWNPTKGKMRSSYLEYPEDAAGIEPRYLGKNWDN